MSRKINSKCIAKNHKCLSRLTFLMVVKDFFLFSHLVQHQNLVSLVWPSQNLMIFSNSEKVKCESYIYNRYFITFFDFLYCCWSSSSESIQSYLTLSFSSFSFRSLIVLANRFCFSNFSFSRFSARSWASFCLDNWYS